LCSVVFLLILRARWSRIRSGRRDAFTQYRGSRPVSAADDQ